MAETWNQHYINVTDLSTSESEIKHVDDIEPLPDGWNKKEYPVLSVSYHDGIYLFYYQEDGGAELFSGRLYNIPHPISIEILVQAIQNELDKRS